MAGGAIIRRLTCFMHGGMILSDPPLTVERLQTRKSATGFQIHFLIQASTKEAIVKVSSHRA